MGGTDTLPKFAPVAPNAVRGRPWRLPFGITADQALWLGSFVSLSAYLLSNKFGTVAIATTLAIWLGYIAAFPVRTVRWAAAAPLLWIMPAWAFASVLWTPELTISFRLSSELLLFTWVSIVMAQVQSARSLISALMCTLILCVVLSLLFGETAAVGFTGETAFIGLFGSKNNFAFVTCLMMLNSMAVLMDRTQHRVFRLLAAFGLLAAPVVIVKTISLGALVSGTVGCSALLSVLVYSSVSPKWRGAFLLVVAGFFIAVFAFVAYAVSQGIDTDTLLTSLGKDPSLTGRTFLWARAKGFIAERPLFGLGYQAFWVQGHVEAEGLWRFADITSRAGFHFHNLFFATAVELGIIGVALLGAQILGTVIAAGRWALVDPRPESAFFFALFIFFMIRMSVELDFLSPFSYGALTMPLTWVFAIRGARRASVGVR